MSKTRAKTYAKAYWEKAQELKDKKKIDKLAKDLAAFLIKKNDLKKARLILAELGKLEDAHLKRVRVNVASARPLSQGEKEALIKAVTKNTDYKEVVIDAKQNKKLIGGMRAQIGWQVIDNTLYGRLERLKERLI